MEACKAGVLNIPIYKRKASYNRSYQAKQIQTEAFAKSKKKKIKIRFIISKTRQHFKI